MRIAQDRISRRLALSLGLSIGLAASSSYAQTSDVRYPLHPIKLIVATPAGGTVDMSARIVAEKLHKLWGQPVIVENKTGGSFNIAGEAVAKAEPDGYTLLATPPSLITVNAVLYKKLTFDPGALEPVAILAVGPTVLVTKAGSPIKSIGDLIAFAKANPGKLTVASQGVGSTGHLALELFAERAGIKLVHVPYRGAAPAVNDLAGGHVDLAFLDLGTILPMHEGGQAAIIAVASSERVPQLPSVPTFEESGLKDFRAITFFSLMAPPKTPLDIRSKLNATIVAEMAAPDVQERMKTVILQSSNYSIPQTDAFIRAEAKLWSDVIRSANIVVDQ